MEWFMQALLVSWVFSILAGTDLTQKIFSFTDVVLYGIGQDT
jgi:hypothetical protein